MADSTKTCFDITIALYDTCPSECYGQGCSRVLIDYERGRFQTWAELQDFSSNGPDMNDVTSQLVQEQMLNIQCALQDVRASVNRR